MEPVCSTAWRRGCLQRFQRRNRVVPWLKPGLQVTAGFGNSFGLFMTWAGAVTPVGVIWGGFWSRVFSEAAARCCCMSSCTKVCVQVPALGLLTWLSQRWRYSLPLQAAKGFLGSFRCTNEPELKLNNSNGWALLGGFGLAFDPRLFLGIPSLHAMLCSPSFSLLLALCSRPLRSVPWVLCLGAGRASLWRRAAAHRAHFSLCPE